MTTLPVQTTSFVWRAGELGELTALIERGALTTLVGPGGVGKTRLAVEIADALATSFVHGVWFADLSSATTEEAVMAELTASVGAIDGTLDALITRVRHDRALLVLDNCEQVIQPLAALVTRLVRACPDVRLLATSREPIAIRGEQRWPVRPLATPDGEHCGSIDGPAVQLFHERALLADPTFRITDENAAAIVEICRALDGLPLALELAAAWIGVLTPAQIAEGLIESLDLLDRSPRDAPDRHRSMRAALGWTYDSLAEDERRVFDALWIFSGGFTPESVAAVCAIDSADAFRILTTLADRSMLSVSYSRTSQPRFTMLHTVSSFAYERTVQAPVTETPPVRPTTDLRRWVLRRSGEYWEVGSLGDLRHVKDSKGMRYLHELVSHPHRDTHVLDLVGGGVVSGSAVEAIDEKAVGSYRARLEDLRDEIADARDANDSERANRLLAEFEAIADELQSATGLGGRIRRAPNAVERARMSVRKALKTAIDRISAVAPDAGRHLSGAVRTGAFCSYDPETGVTPDWEL